MVSDELFFYNTLKSCRLSKENPKVFKSTYNSNFESDLRNEEEE
jgi:hypothetical protein